MKSHKRKMIAPIIVSVLMILYFILYFGVFMWLLDGIWVYLFGIIPLLIVIMTIAVCIERIKEIKKGEEDDLSKY